jgi:hypothetical protein
MQRKFRQSPGLPLNAPNTWIAPDKPGHARPCPAMTPQSGHKRSPDPNNSYRSRSQIPRPVLAPAVAPERPGAHGLALSSRSAASGGPNPRIRLNFTLKSTAFNRRPSPRRRRLRPASPSRFSTGRRLRFPNRRPRRLRRRISLASAGSRERAGATASSWEEGSPNRPAYRSHEGCAAG